MSPEGEAAHLTAEGSSTALSDTQKILSSTSRDDASSSRGEVGSAGDGEERLTTLLPTKTDEETDPMPPASTQEQSIVLLSEAEGSSPFFTFLAWLAKTLTGLGLLFFLVAIFSDPGFVPKAVSGKQAIDQYVKILNGDRSYAVTK